MQKNLFKKLNFVSFKKVSFVPTGFCHNNLVCLHARLGFVRKWSLQKLWKSLLRGYLTCWSRWYHQNCVITSRSAATSTFWFSPSEKNVRDMPSQSPQRGYLTRWSRWYHQNASKRPVRSLRALLDSKSRCYQTPWKSNRGCPRPCIIQCHPLLVAQTRQEGFQLR